MRYYYTNAEFRTSDDVFLVVVLCHPWSSKSTKGSLLLLLLLKVSKLLLRRLRNRWPHGVVHLLLLLLHVWIPVVSPTGRRRLNSCRWSRHAKEIRVGSRSRRRLMVVEIEEGTTRGRRRCSRSGCSPTKEIIDGRSARCRSGLGSGCWCGNGRGKIISIVVVVIVVQIFVVVHLVHQVLKVDLLHEIDDAVSSHVFDLVGKILSLFVQLEGRILLEVRKGTFQAVNSLELASRQNKDTRRDRFTFVQFLVKAFGCSLVDRDLHWQAVR
mmetsp:Transcript_15962/g.32982  ORF Transcript_15962/g.32982 Transcript_15962/m.32982 type:complete len:269 (+) Transcript_15962:245-1051(+)